MTVYSLSYQFRQSFRAPAGAAYAWCTDFGPGDGKLLEDHWERSVRRIAEDALVLTDTNYPEGRRRRIRRLVRLVPSERMWTNTHLDGPFRHSQYWYRIVPDGPGRSHLEFRGLRLLRSSARLSPKEVARRAEQELRNDSGLWRTSLAPAMERDLSSPRRRGSARSSN